MAICHQCYADNPDQQASCKQCGASLTPWLAIIQGSEDYASLNPLDAVDLLQLVSTSSGAETSAPGCQTLTFIDAEQRYRFLHIVAFNPDQPAESGQLTWEVEAQVLDLYPHKATPLQDVHNLNAIESKPECSAVLSALPDSAKSYVVLQQQLQVAIPLLHNAWQQADRVVLLLEDRSTLPLLQDLCLQSSLSPLLVLQWLWEMLHLWSELGIYRCQSSLLEISNIHVDANQHLCLQRLYLDPTPQVTIRGLQDLGQVWEKLFHPFLLALQNQKTSAVGEHLCHLIACVSANMIVSSSDLEIMLTEIIEEFQQQEAASVTAHFEQSVPLSSYASTSPSNPERELLDIFQWPSSVEMPFDSTVSHPLYTTPDPSATSSDTLPPTAWLEDREEIEEATVILPMRLSHINVVTLTDAGKQRTHNEDFFSSETWLAESVTPKGRLTHAKGLYILCDGMGGHAGGEVASSLACETLQTFFRNVWQTKFPGAETISEGIFTANDALFTLNQQRASYGSNRMGTTVVMVLLQDTQLAFAHVGDSRLYRVTRKRGLELLTTDHEVGQREIQRGVDPEVAYARVDAYQLTQALGPRDSAWVKPDIQTFSIQEDSLLLLCSDGLTDNDLVETYWQSHLLPLISSKANLEEGIQNMIDLANQHNGHDNSSIIAVRVKVLPDLTAVTYSDGV